MEKFHCYICLTDVECVFAKQVCIDQKHQVCSLCHPKVNCEKCPMCRQKNPNFVPFIDNDSDVDSDSEEEVFLVLRGLTQQQLAVLNHREFIQQFLGLSLTHQGNNGWQ